MLRLALPERKETEQPETPQPITKSYKAGKPFEGKDTLAGGRDQINRLAELGVARYNDGKFRYVDYDEHYKMLRQHGFEDGRAQEIVKNRMAPVFLRADISPYITRIFADTG